MFSAGTVVLAAASVAYFVWGAREGYLEIWRFWTTSSPPAMATQPSPFHSGVTRLIVALSVAWAAVGLLIRAPRQAVLGSLLITAGSLDLYARTDTHGAPTVFFVLMLFLAVVLGIVRRERPQDAGGAGSEQPREVDEVHALSR